jgi:hypothetical protein
VCSLASAASRLRARATGWTMQPATWHSVFFDITSTSATTITVRGDATSQVPSSRKGQTWYFIMPLVTNWARDRSLFRRCRPNKRTPSSAE